MQKIMFNDKYCLTEAVLTGRKTQTRRFIPKDFFTLQWDVRDDTLVVENEWGDFIDIRNTKFCMFTVGEVVAIAQSYKNAGLIPHSLVPKVDGSMIAASNHKGWTNKMFVKPELMPHQIRITNVRIERLHDISDEDCLAEGVELNTRQYEYDGTKYYCVRGLGHWRSFGCYNYESPREAYAALIDKVGKKGDWESNQYVFVYDFELVK